MNHIKVFWKIFSLLVLATFIPLISGCGVSKDATAGQPAARHTVEGYDGVAVSLPKKPMRIMTDSMTFDTMVVGIVPPERLISANYLDDDPQLSYIVEATKDIEVRRKTFGIFNAEYALQLKPDLIIVSDYVKDDAIQTLRDLGFPVLVCKSPTDIADIKADITLIAKALDEEPSGTRIIAEMDKQLQEIDIVMQKQKGPMPVGMLVSRMTNYGGKGSMFDELCQKAHIINGIAKAGLNQGDFLAKELVVKAEPDFFMISAPADRPDNADTEQFNEEFLHDPALQGLKGLQKVISIPDRYLYSNSQNCVYAIKGLANYAYGNLFDLSNEHLIKGY